MKTIKDVSDYTLPNPIGALVGVYITLQGNTQPVKYTMVRVDSETLAKAKKNQPNQHGAASHKAMPMMFSFDPVSNVMSVHPSPDQVYDIEIQYYPPMETM